MDPPPPSLISRLQSLARVQMRISQLSRHEVRPVGVFACVCVCFSPPARTRRCSPSGARRPRALGSRQRAKCAALAALQNPLIIIIRLPPSAVIRTVNQMSRVECPPPPPPPPATSRGPTTRITRPDTSRLTQEDTRSRQVVSMSHLHLLPLIADGGAAARC